MGLLSRLMLGGKSSYTVGASRVKTEYNWLYYVRTYVALAVIEPCAFSLPPRTTDSLGLAIHFIVFITHLQLSNKAEYDLSPI